MRVNRGCGCLLLLLAFVNVVFLVSGVISLVQGRVTAVYGAILILLFIGNVVAAAMVGLSGIRRIPLGGATAAEDTDAASEVEGEVSQEGED